ncbi:MAG: hypothetical protein ACMXYG_06075 [Candidatus Woesearchaeota archaeon]
MGIEEKIPKGQFGVVLWDSYPQQKPYVCIQDLFQDVQDAIKYAQEKNQDLSNDFGVKKLPLIEPEYIVLDSSGMRY